MGLQTSDVDSSKLMFQLLCDVRLEWGLVLVFEMVLLSAIGEGWKCVLALESC